MEPTHVGQEYNIVIPSRLQLLAVFVLLFFLFWLVSLIRKQKIPLRGSLSLLLSTLAVLAVVCFPEIFLDVAHDLGFVVASNAIFVFGFLYVLWNIVSTTVTLATIRKRTIRLTQECSMLRAEIDELRDRVETISVSSDAPKV